MTPVDDDPSSIIDASRVDHSFSGMERTPDAETNETRDIPTKVDTLDAAEEVQVSLLLKKVPIHISPAS